MYISVCIYTVKCVDNCGIVGGPVKYGFIAKQCQLCTKIDG